MTDASPAAPARSFAAPAPPAGPPIAVVLAVVALLTRAIFLGNPLLDSDEGFYLLVGDRMLHGALPYVDLWDRKPVGLFLLYAGIRLLGGDGVLAYQLVGTMAATGAAWLVARIALPFAGRFGATAAGCAYLVWLTLGSASGGQAELFYALPVAAAATLTLGGLQGVAPRALPWRGAAAMLLIGVAAQIKYNALFEGMFFGCCWLWIGWRAGRRAALVPLACLWIAAAVLPTALALAYYAARGALDPFLFANFLSIWHRARPAPPVLLVRLASMALILAPLLACALSGARIAPGAGAGARIAPGPARTAHRFTLGWLAAAIVAVLGFGTYLEQYLLPITVPASAAAARVLGGGARRRAFLFLVPFGLLGQIKLGVTELAHGSRAQLAAVTDRIDRRHCLFVYSGVAALYRISGSCIPTRFAFPSHLSRAREADAIGIDPVAEVDRIMRSRPATVIVRAPYGGDENLPARAAVLRHLQSYAHVYSGKLGWKAIDVYRAD